MKVTNDNSLEELIPVKRPVKKIILFLIQLMYYANSVLAFLRKKVCIYINEIVPKTVIKVILMMKIIIIVNQQRDIEF